MLFKIFQSINKILALPKIEKQTNLIFYSKNKTVYETVQKWKPYVPIDICKNVTAQKIFLFDLYSLWYIYYYKLIYLININLSLVLIYIKKG